MPAMPGDEISFLEIQVGDQIRRTYRRGDGTTQITEGVVAKLWGQEATSRSGYYIAARGDDVIADVTIELIARPEKPLWEQAEVGDMIVAYRSALATGRDYRFLYYKTEQGWVLPVKDELIHLEQLKKYLAEEERIELRKCRNGNAD